jgi:hypothetical protein
MKKYVYVKEDTVVQINEKGKDGWIGCLVQVSEVKGWGVQGWVQLPMKGSAYIRLQWDEIEYIGEAILSPQKSSE